jgi:hypothetical protein
MFVMGSFDFSGSLTGKFFIPYSPKGAEIFWPRPATSGPVL